MIKDYSLKSIEEVSEYIKRLIAEGFTDVSEVKYGYSTGYFHNYLLPELEESAPEFSYRFQFEVYFTDGRLIRSNPMQVKMEKLKTEGFIERMVEAVIERMG